MASYLTLFLLFLLQFIYLPIGASHFETPKVYAAEIGILLVLLVTLFATNNISLQKVKKKKFIPFAVLFLLTLLDLLFLRTSTTLPGNAFRLQGVFLLWLLMAFAFVSTKNAIDKKISPFLIFGCLIVQLLFALLIDGGVNQRGVGTLGEPNALAAATVFVWPFLFFSQKHVPKIFKLLSILITISILYLTDSRSGMIAFVLQILFLGLLFKARLSYKVAAIICIIVLLVSYVLPFIEQKGFYEKRSEVWQVAAVSGWQSPIIGHGFGNTEFALRQASKSVKTNLSGSYIDSAHNIFLDWWVQGGVVGLGILCLLLYQTINAFIKKKQTRNMILLLGLLAALSFNPPSVVALVAFWWLLGNGSCTNL